VVGAGAEVGAGFEGDVRVSVPELAAGEHHV